MQVGAERHAFAAALTYYASWHQDSHRVLATGHVASTAQAGSLPCGCNCRYASTCVLITKEPSLVFYKLMKCCCRCVAAEVAPTTSLSSCRPEQLQTAAATITLPCTPLRPACSKQPGQHAHRPSHCRQVSPGNQTTPSSLLHGVCAAVTSQRTPVNIQSLPRCRTPTPRVQLQEQSPSAASA